MQIPIQLVFVGTEILWVIFVVIICLLDFSFFVVLGFEPRGSYKLGKCCTTELHSQYLGFFKDRVLV